ncbi:asparaginase [Mycena alexandri]|uniref:Asparaginase n=1 Tax=Mycena alexandri TaxID=1745969 RepID=A0AAD6TKZ1_9AGAR|nr:asparaginase [Mycena alexandri]
MTMERAKTYVIVHGGAGTHSKNSEAEVKKELRLACTLALNADNGSALSLVEYAIMSLEDSPLLNAGYGSNLALDGSVECDAAIMDGVTGDFGSAGAVSGVKNPIRLAHRILKHALLPDPLARIPPLTLVSSGALAFARNYNSSRATSDPDASAIELVPPESLITLRTLQQWGIWKARLDAGARGVSSIEGTSDDEEEEEVGLRAPQDTVGAIAFTLAPSGGSRLASGVSSGGILLKHPGRMGEAAVFGAGCWAQAARPGKMGVACSVSGAGEYIVRANLARLVCDAITKGEDVDVHEILQRVLAEDFWKPSRSPVNPDPGAGIILLTTEEDDDGRPIGRLWCAFTTSSMAIAYASSENPQGKAFILRRPKAVESRPNDQPRIVITGFSL